MGILVLTILYWAIDYTIQKNLHNNYYVKLGGNMTYQMNNFTLVIGRNQENLYRSLSVYEPDNESSWRIFSSLLSGESNNDIMPNEILFNHTQIFPFKISNILKIITVTVKNIEPGMYHGWFYLAGKTTIAIPVTISTEPKVIQAIIIVIIGTLFSIAFWEIFFYLYVIGNKGAAKKAMAKVQDIQNQYVKGQSPPAENLQYTKSLIEIATRREKNAIGTENRYLENAGKIFTVDIASIGFAILTALLGLFKDNYVTHLAYISRY